MLATVYTKYNPTTGELVIPETYVFDGNKQTWSNNAPFPEFSNLVSVMLGMARQGDQVTDVLKSRIEERIGLEEATDILRDVFFDSNAQIEVKDHIRQNDVSSSGMTAKISYRLDEKSGLTGIYTNKYGKDGVTFYLWTLEGEVSDFPEELTVLTNPSDKGNRLWFKSLTNEGEELSTTVWIDPEAPLIIPKKGDKLLRNDGKKFYVKTHETFGRQISISADKLRVLF